MKKLSLKIIDSKSAPKLISSYKEKNKKIVLCHGVFDIFHFGHLKHLEKAKTYGDILVVSLTRDEFIKKGPGRPVFNENLRSELIANLEIVDYVILSNSNTAVNNIELIKPNFYIKGDDYKKFSSDITGNITKEKKAVEKNKGKIIFTNEIVFSSSSLINSHFEYLPLKLRKYINSFNSKNILSEIHKSLQKMQKMNVLVIGEVIIDEYKYVKPMGKSAKENIIGHQYINNEIYCGGSLATALVVSEFSKSVTLLTSMKDDYYKKYINKKIETRKNIKIKSYNSKNIKTPHKTRYIENSFFRKLFASYNLDDEMIDLKTEYKIIKYINENIKKYDLVIINDFGHYLFTKKIIKKLSSLKKFKSVNVQSNSSNYGYNLISKYQNMNYTCIDEPEARLAVSDSSSKIDDIIVNKLRKLHKTKQLMITLGHRGCIVDNKNSVYNLPALASKVSDTMGAGDAFFAITSMFAYLNSKSEILALVGNIVGAIKVNIIGHREHVTKISFIKYLETILK